MCLLCCCFLPINLINVTINAKDRILILRPFDNTCFTAKRIYDDSGYEWSYEIEDDVVVFDMKGWMGYDEDNLEAATQAYIERSLTRKISMLQ